MLLAAVSVLVVAQSSSEIPEGLMNNPIYGLKLSQCSQWSGNILFKLGMGKTDVSRVCTVLQVLLATTVALLSQYCSTFTVTGHYDGSCCSPTLALTLLVDLPILYLWTHNFHILVYRGWRKLLMQMECICTAFYLGALPDNLQNLVLLLII